MKRLFFVLLALGMLACSPRDIGAQVGSSVPGLPTSSTSAGPHCADLYMQAQVSSKPVKGVWNCLAKPVQDGINAAAASGVAVTPGDGFLATETGYSEQYWYIGREHTGGYVYEVRATKGATVQAATIVIYLAADGTIATTRPSQPITLA